jgi:6-phosphogluconolactonase/glucosamine-6-phosphate isomerase/deaminase
MRIISSDNCQGAALKAADYLANELATPVSQGKEVLWLVSGGSSVAVAINAAQLLNVAQTKHITVAQIDERMVSTGSKQENWQQLLNSGFNPADFKQAVSMLSTGSQPEEIAKNYGRLLQQLIGQSGAVIGLFGIGENGHTAGIMPAANAAEFDSFKGPELVASYRADDFTRITITEACIKQMTSIVAYACGEKKRSVVEQLNMDLPVHAQPAQLLKSVAAAVVFN